MTALLVTSCSWLKPGPPWQAWMYEGPPGDNSTLPPLYLEGWKDGCHTGVHTNTAIIYKPFFGWKQDPIKAQNRVYYKGWKDAFDYCQRYIWQYEKRLTF